MTVLCWNTTWINVHSGDCNFFNFFLLPRYFLTKGKNKNNNNNNNNNNNTRVKK